MTWFLIAACAVLAIVALCEYSLKRATEVQLDLARQEILRLRQLADLATKSDAEVARSVVEGSRGET